MCTEKTPRRTEIKLQETYISVKINQIYSLVQSSYAIGDNFFHIILPIFIGTIEWPSEIIINWNKGR